MAKSKITSTHGPIVMEDRLQHTYAGVFSSGQHNPTWELEINGINIATRYAAQQGGNNGTEGLAVGIEVPNTATIYGVNALAGYVHTKDASANTVSLYGQNEAGIDGCNIFSLNTLMADGGFENVQMQNELDFNVSDVSTVVHGLTFKGESSAQPTDAAAIIIDALKISDNSIYWPLGIVFVDGACQTALDIGTVGPANDVASAKIKITGRDSGATERVSEIYSSAGGALLVEPGLDMRIDQPVCVAAAGASVTAPIAPLHLLSGTNGTSAIQIDNTSGGANGVAIALYADSASPIDNDVSGEFKFFINDDQAAMRQNGALIVQQLDVTDSTLDSQILFATMDNVNQGDVNTFASLSSIGVWTDASGAEGKTFEGRPVDILAKIKTLRVEPYRSSRVAGDKIADAERHCSPTAEDFYAAFGLGPNPTKINPRIGRPLLGIAPKDLAGVALIGLQDLLARVEKLESARG